MPRDQCRLAMYRASAYAYTSTLIVRWVKTMMVIQCWLSMKLIKLWLYPIHDCQMLCCVRACILYRKHHFPYGCTIFVKHMRKQWIPGSFSPPPNSLGARLCATGRAILGSTSYYITLSLSFMTLLCLICTHCLVFNWWWLTKTIWISEVFTCYISSSLTFPTCHASQVHVI